MRISSSLIAALLIGAPFSSVAAQFWAQPPTGQIAPQGSPAPPSSVAQTPPRQFIVGEPRSAAPAGPAASLGGSGATGPDSVGTLPERDTGFDLKTWRDTQFAVVLQLLDGLPNQIDSAAEHELAKNLLVSIADQPPNDDGAGRMLQKRVQKLLALGNADDAAALARAAPGLPRDAVLAHAEIEAELLAGQIEAACIDLRAFAPLLSDPISANALLLCRQRSGETIEGGIPAIPADSLGIYVRIAGAPLSFDPAASPPARLVAAARDMKLGPEQRLEAAFSAGRASAMDGESLARIFRRTPAAVAVPAPESPAPTSSAPPTNGADAAALFRSIDLEGDTNIKLALAEHGLLSPKGVSDKLSVAMVAPLRNLQPEAELGPLAARFAILFYTLGDVEAATPWAELAEQSGLGAPLWPYRVLLKQANPIGLVDWRQQAGLDPAHMARILTILSAFDITSAPSGRVAGDMQPEPVFTSLLAIDQAARDNHIGETVLRALILLGRNGPADAHPLALRRALADIDAVHLHNEAHALAFEAITATLMGH